MTEIEGAWFPENARFRKATDRLAQLVRGDIVDYAENEPVRI